MSRTFIVWEVVEKPTESGGGCGGCLILLLGLLAFQKEIINYLNNSPDVIRIVGIIVLILVAFFTLKIILSYISGTFRMVRNSGVFGCLGVLTSFVLVGIGTAGAAFFINGMTGNPLDLSFEISDVVGQIRAFIDGPMMTTPVQIALILSLTLVLLIGAVTTIHISFLGTDN